MPENELSESDTFCPYRLGFYMLLTEWKLYLAIRKNHLTKPSPDSYTVLVERIPAWLLSEEKLRKPGGRSFLN